MSNYRTATLPDASNLTAYQRDCLVSILVRLDPYHPGFSGTDQVKYLLSASDIPTPGCVFPTCDLYPYLDSWVIPLVRLALYGPDAAGASSPHDVARYAGTVRAALKSSQGVDPTFPEARNLTNHQRDCLVTLLARLDPRQGGRASDGVKYLLASTSIPTPGCTFPTGGLQPYLHSWVLPLIRLALYGPAHPEACLPRHVVEHAARAWAGEHPAPAAGR